MPNSLDNEMAYANIQLDGTNYVIRLLRDSDVAPKTPYYVRISNGKTEGKRIRCIDVTNLRQAHDHFLMVLELYMYAKRRVATGDRRRYRVPELSTRVADRQR